MDAPKRHEENFAVHFDLLNEEYSSALFNYSKNKENNKNKKSRKD